MCSRIVNKSISVLILNFLQIFKSIFRSWFCFYICETWDGWLLCSYNRQQICESSKFAPTKNVMHSLYLMPLPVSYTHLDVYKRQSKEGEPIGRFTMTIYTLTGTDKTLTGLALFTNRRVVEWTFDKHLHGSFTWDYMLILLYTYHIY